MLAPWIVRLIAPGFAANPEKLRLTVNLTRILFPFLAAVSLGALTLGMLNSHPEVTHWLVTGLNDDSAVAPMRVFEEAGFPIENVIACGMGGYSLSYEEFQKDHESYIAIKLQPQMHGSEGVRVLYEYIVEGKPLAGNTTTSGVVVTKDEYMNYTWE